MNNNIPFDKKPLDLTAIEVRIDEDTTKHIGKVGRCPIMAHDSVAGRRILYKEVFLNDIWCRQTGSYSMDRVGFDYALSKYKFDKVAIFVLDSNARALLVTLPMVIQSSPVLDLGERPQYRFRTDRVEAIRGEHQINMGWTNRSIVVDDVLDLVGLSKREADIKRSGAVGLFDLSVGDRG